MKFFVERFEKFFDNYYRQEIYSAFEEYPNKRSLNVDFSGLNKVDPDLAAKVQQNPDELTVAAEEAIQGFMPPIFEDERPVHVRFYNLMHTLKIPLKNLHSEELDRLYQLEGIITSVEPSGFIMKKAMWRCFNCNTTFKTSPDNNNIKSPSICQCGRREFKLFEKPGLSEFNNFQVAQIKELVEKKQNKATKLAEIRLEDDLIEQVVLREKYVLTGIPRHKEKIHGNEKKRHFKFLDVVHLQRT